MKFTRLVASSFTALIVSSAVALAQPATTLMKYLGTDHPSATIGTTRGGVYDAKIGGHLSGSSYIGGSSQLTP